MEDDSTHQPRATSLSKPMGQHVKEYLEQWFKKKGKPKTIVQADKDALLRYIQSNIQPAGISLNQLNCWLSKHRRQEKDATGSPRSFPPRKRTGLDILFPKLSSAELDYMKILTQETPYPSSDLVAMWAESSSFPNLTIDDANRYIKYNQARLRQYSVASLGAASSSKLDSYNDDVEMADATQSDEEEDMLTDDRDSFDHAHLPTPDSTSPEPVTHPLKPDPCDSPVIPLRQDQLNAGSVSAQSQLPADPRALLQMLRSQLSTAELQKLLQEGSELPTSTASTCSSSNPDIALHLLDPCLLSPTSLSHSLPHSPVSNPIHSTAEPSHGPQPQMSHSDRSSSRLTTVTRAKAPLSSPMPSLGHLPRNILDELAELFHKTASGKPRTLGQCDLEPCQRKSEALMTALERGKLRVFGLIPSDELEISGMGKGGSGFEDTGVPPEPP